MKIFCINSYRSFKTRYTLTTTLAAVAYCKFSLLFARVHLVLQQTYIVAKKK